MQFFCYILHGTNVDPLDSGLISIRLHVMMNKSVDYGTENSERSKECVHKYISICKSHVWKSNPMNHRVIFLRYALLLE